MMNSIIIRLLRADDNDDDEGDRKMRWKKCQVCLIYIWIIMYRSVHGKKFYIRSIIRQYKKYYSETCQVVCCTTQDGALIFIWSENDNVVVVHNIDVLQGLPNPAIHRRGSSLIKTFTDINQCLTNPANQCLSDV